jgi:hypothetical protein
LDDKEAFSNFAQHRNKWVADGKSQLTIYHQNMQDLKNKINDFVLTKTEIYPHIICLSEHHLKPNEKSITHIPMYNWNPTILDLP